MHCNDVIVNVLIRRLVSSNLSPPTPLLHAFPTLLRQPPPPVVAYLLLV